MIHLTISPLIQSYLLHAINTYGNEINKDSNPDPNMQAQKVFVNQKLKKVTMPIRNNI